jgi:hypothetical protein
MYTAAPASKWDRIDRHATSENLTLGAMILVLMMIATVVAWFFSDGDPSLDKTAYKDTVIGQSDLPSPPFIGWERQDLDDPRPPSAFAVTDKWDQEECRSDSPSYKTLDKMVSGGEGWSGAQFYNPAYDNLITVQVASSRQGSTSPLSTLRTDCAAMSAQDGDRQYSGTLSNIDVNVQPFGFNNGMEWVTEHSVYDGDQLAGTQSTAVLLAREKRTTVMATISIPGPMEDNALKSMQLAFRAQAAKIAAMQDDDGDADDGE